MVPGGIQIHILSCKAQEGHRAKMPASSHPVPRFSFPLSPILDWKFYTTYLHDKPFLTPFKSSLQRLSSHPLQTILLGSSGTEKPLLSPQPPTFLPYNEPQVIGGHSSPAGPASPADLSGLLPVNPFLSNF